MKAKIQELRTIARAVWFYLTLYLSLSIQDRRELLYLAALRRRRRFQLAAAANATKSDNIRLSEVQ